MIPKLLGITILLHCSLAMPVHSAEHNHDDGEVEDYLDHYYQCHDEKMNHTTKERLEIMQEFLHLPVTGEADSETVQAVHKPRCGVPDVLEYNVIPGSKKWPKNNLTYRINNYTTDMSKEDIHKAVAFGFQVWAQVTLLRFHEVTEKGIYVDINIWFSKRDHGDMYPFDGPGKVLAHAFPPAINIGGDCHLDDEEVWSVKNEGVCLAIVMAHELGHSLGLHHSKDPYALMYPAYFYRDPDTFELPLDDKLGVQSLYGSNPDYPEYYYDPEYYEWSNEWENEDKDPNQHQIPKGSSEDDSTKESMASNESSESKESKGNDYN